MPEAPLSDQQLETITNALLQGNKIAAIKAYREATGLGLKEAKEEVERITADLVKAHPEIAPSTRSGCAGVIAIGILFVAGVAVFVGPWATTL